MHSNYSNKYINWCGPDADVIAGQINGAGFTNVKASVDPANRIVIQHTKGGEMKFVDTDGTLAEAGFLQTTTNMGYESNTGAGTNPNSTEQVTGKH